ncbi:3-deoxy-D-manno-octulosonic acid kinase [Litorilituus lipolyticus]|uniref:3-deoxy-D-manno-octulosonic acid kinase n=1 Tax=Litorilituus lipolyticus TaxID=2491017 RepID=A0A502L5P0_9GAMM|nr:3-deoxy-D-manno-octulosonic acid kinase [Litorilituus lipolyticus]TPH15627.1 3-deoxy-D-manno-octulosonic acid kinase [Litorilituus lipolyticus]
MINELNLHNHFCRYDSDKVSNFSVDMLSANYWQAKDAITGSAQGRGTTWFIQYQSNESNSPVQQWVLRHYYRGGLIGKVINDSYFFTGIDHTRAAKEFALLHHLQSLNLPAPLPIAFGVKRSSLFYQADLLSSRIENAQDLVAILSKQTLDGVIWQRIGATIKRFHKHNIYHHDLNAHNILLDDKQQVFIIDFDQGEVKNCSNTAWKQGNIARLKRSFEKENNKLPEFNFTQPNWQQLITGYNK